MTIPTSSPLPVDYRIEFFAYDWNVNDQRSRPLLAP